MKKKYPHDCFAITVLGIILGSQLVKGFESIIEWFCFVTIYGTRLSLICVASSNHISCKVIYAPLFSML